MTAFWFYPTSLKILCGLIKFQMQFMITQITIIIKDQLLVDLIFFQQIKEFQASIFGLFDLQLVKWIICREKMYIY